MRRREAEKEEKKAGETSKVFFPIFSGLLFSAARGAKSQFLVGEKKFGGLGQEGQDAKKAALYGNFQAESLRPGIFPQFLAFLALSGSHPASAADPRGPPSLVPTSGGPGGGLSSFYFMP